MTNETINVMPVQVQNAITLLESLRDYLQTPILDSTPEIKQWMLVSLTIIIVTLLVIRHKFTSNPLADSMWKVTLIILISTLVSYTISNLLRMLL